MGGRQLDWQTQDAQRLQLMQEVHKNCTKAEHGLMKKKKTEDSFSTPDQPCGLHYFDKKKKKKQKKTEEEEAEEEEENSNKNINSNNKVCHMS